MEVNHTHRAFTQVSVQRMAASVTCRINSKVLRSSLFTSLPFSQPLIKTENNGSASQNFSIIMSLLQM